MIITISRRSFDSFTTILIVGPNNFDNFISVILEYVNVNVNDYIPGIQI